LKVLKTSFLNQSLLKAKHFFVPDEISRIAMIEQLGTAPGNMSAMQQ